MTFDALTGFGVAMAGIMLVAYARQPRSHWYTFVFALASVCAAAYAFLIGAWVFGLLELSWYLIAMRRWVNRQVYE